MVKEQFFIGINRSRLKLDLPIVWQEEGSFEKSSHFILTDHDLVFHSSLGLLKASHLAIKYNPILEQVFQRKGKNITQVIDATCGYSLDSMILLKQGCQVTGYESNNFAQIFIQYFLQTKKSLYKNFTFSMKCFSSIHSLETECLYLDPMFDDIRKRRSRLSMYLLSLFQEKSAKESLELLKIGIKKIKAGCIIVKSSKREKPLLKGFVTSIIDLKSVRYWRFYTNYLEITDEHFENR